MAQPNDPNTKPPAPVLRSGQDVTGQFVRELIVFIIGLLLGFFWYLYSEQSKSVEAHIVIGLLVIILCLGRYIMIARQ